LATLNKKGEVDLSRSDFDLYPVIGTSIWGEGPTKGPTLKTPRQLEPAIANTGFLPTELF